MSSFTHKKIIDLNEQILQAIAFILTVEDIYFTGIKHMYHVCNFILAVVDNDY